MLIDDKLYFLRENNGTLTCLNAKKGAVIYSKEKVEGISTLFSPPTGADNKIYSAAENICLDITAGENFKILASNQLNYNFHASPVAVENDVILRRFKHLYCFSEE